MAVSPTYDATPLKASAGDLKRWTRQAVVSGLIVLTCVTPACTAFVQHPVAALELPLETSRDRADLLTILKNNADANGLHVDDVSQRWRDFLNNVKDQPATSPVEKTIYVGLWRGPDDDDLEVSIDDGGHQGRPWVVFYNGKRPILAGKDRGDLIAALRHRWPRTITIPIAPEGGLPTVQQVETLRK